METNHKTSETNNQVLNNQVKNRIPLGDKITYAICLCSGMYFVVRFIVGVVFNV